MASATQSTIRAVLRTDGPLSVDEILARVAARQPIVTKNPKQTVRNALSNDSLCQSTVDGCYVYLPTFARLACVRVPMERAAPAQGLLAVSAEVAALLWPLAEWAERGPTPLLSLEGGPEVAAIWKSEGLWGRLHTLVGLPAAFWTWWQECSTGGADALVVRCEDGEAGRFTVKATCTADLSVEAVAARNAQLREATATVLKRTRGVRAGDLVRRLFAQGIYHGEPTPDPLSAVLFGPDGAFCLEHMRVTHLPGLTPALRRLFAPRLVEELMWEDIMIRELLGLPPQPVLEPPAQVRPRGRKAERGFRVKVSLQWDRRIWRVIEMLDNQTLEDLHLAIQDAFNWDNDHLYAFFLSGQAWDRLTEISGPFGDDAEPPTTDEITLGELELRPKQRFLYLFDFGDQLGHEIEVVDAFPVTAPKGFPRLVESHGEAPPQYPEWNEEWEEEEAEE